MILQFGVTLLPVGIIGIASLLILVIIVLQCAKKDERFDEEQGRFKRTGSTECIANKAALENAAVGIPEKECNSPSETQKKRSPTDNSTTTDGSDVKRELKIENHGHGANKQECVKAGTSIANETIKVDDINAEVAHHERNRQNSSPKENATPTNGSVENSGSGDSMYTKVKTVATQEESAYSVVELASKDTEYELVGGRLKRLEHVLESKEEKSTDFNDYELIEPLTPKKKIQLDPVLFAIENSGSSGIYEDVSDSKMAVQTNQGKNIENNGNELHPHDSKTKKWGITRFSLRARNKTKTDDAKEASTHHGGSPTSKKRSPVNAKKSFENQKLPDSVDGKEKSEGRTARQISVKGSSPSTDENNIPPPPPIENLRLKADHRRTILVNEEHSEVLDNPSLLRQSSVPDTVILAVADQEVEDALYEVPDKEIVKRVRQSSKTDAIILQEEHHKRHLVAKDIPEKDYETISSDLDLHDAEYGRPAKAKARPSEPEYAVVDRSVGKKGNSRKNNVPNEEHDASGQQDPASEEKIAVFLTKTQISCRLSGDANNPPDLEVKNGGGVSPQKDAADEPPDLDALYAKVDMAKKREEEAKKALYASVNKVKTGICKYYDDEGDDEDFTSQDYYEDGHYTRITDKASPNLPEQENGSLPVSGTPDGKSGEDVTSVKQQNEYEELSEQKNLEMFSAIRAPRPEGSLRRENSYERQSNDYEAISDMKM